MHHHRSFRFTGMIVYFSFKVAFRRNNTEPVSGYNQEIRIDKSKVTYHAFEVIASMPADNNQFTHPLSIQGSYNIFQNGLLGRVAGVYAERKFTLSGIMSTKRYGRHHHTAHP